MFGVRPDKVLAVLAVARWKKFLQTCFLFSFRRCKGCNAVLHAVVPSAGSHNDLLTHMYRDRPTDLLTETTSTPACITSCSRREWWSLVAFFLLPRLSLCRSSWWCFPCSFASRNSCRLPPPFFKLSFVGPKSKANKIHSHYSPIVFEKEQKAIIWECIEPRYIHGLEGNRRTFWGTEPREPV
jgi:hypothetical protein